VKDNRISWITDQAILILASGFERRRMYHILDIIPANLTYAVVQRGQEYLAEEMLCIEKSASLTFSGGTVSEPTGFYRMNYLDIDASKKQPIEIDIREKYRLAESLSTTSGPVSFLPRFQTYIYRYGGTMYTWPAIDDGAYTLYYWGRPTTTVDENINPETPAHLDRALLYWTVKEIADMMRQGEMSEEYNDMFLREMDSPAHGRTQTEDFSIVASNL